MLNVRETDRAKAQSGSHAKTQGTQRRTLEVQFSASLRLGVRSCASAWDPTASLFHCLGTAAFVLFASMTGAQAPSFPCISILKVYAVGDSSLMVTRVFIFCPPIR